MAKPFVKWAGGKGKLITTLENKLQSIFANAESVTYIEPFVGGGAMLFHMLETHPNIKRVIINDINPELMNCYEHIKNHLDELLIALHNIEDRYYECQSQAERKKYYYSIRDEYNEGRHPADELLSITHADMAADFIFLNRTCFNGLYRENKRGGFNVPFGKYEHPQICNEPLLRQVHDALQKVTILCGNYQDVLKEVKEGETTFFYLDPPYRPLPGANNFKDYTQHEFGDRQQEELHDFCVKIHENGCLFMLSNSDSEIEDGVNYFEQLYEGFNFGYVMAPRVINAFAAGRVPQREVLITNFEQEDHD